MAVVVTMNIKFAEDKSITVAAGLVFSGSYPALGEPFDFLAGPYTRGTGKTASDRIGYTDQQPFNVSMDGKAGFVYTYDFANKKIRIWTSNGAAPAALAELPTAAYPAGVTGDTISAMVIFLKK